MFKNIINGKKVNKQTNKKQDKKKVWMSKHNSKDIREDDNSFHIKCPY